jgi:hypothetical protein
MLKILGTGETLKFHTKVDGETIGVNDIWGFVETDYILTVDDFNNFKQKRYFPRLQKSISRLECIKQSKPQKFLSQLTCWKDVVNYEHIRITRFNGVGSLKEIQYSNNSPFVALSWAINNGYKTISFFGVDFVSHKNLSYGAHPGRFQKLIADYKDIAVFCKQYGIKVYAGDRYSILADIFPVLK